MVSIFTYGFAATDEAFKKAGVELQPLTDYPTLIELAIEKGMITADQQVVLLNWRTDPANWTGI
jgi:orotate phosphoribosyltransferase